MFALNQKFSKNLLLLILASALLFLLAASAGADFSFLFAGDISAGSDGVQKAGMNPLALLMLGASVKRNLYNFVTSKYPSFSHVVRPETLIYPINLDDSNAFELNLVDFAKTATSNALNKGDVFWFNRMALGLQKVEKEGSKLYEANAPIVFFPDPSIFPAEAVKALESVYNSFLEFKTQDDIRLRNFHTQQFRKPSENKELTDFHFVDLGVYIGMEGHLENLLTLTMKGSIQHKDKIGGSPAVAAVAAAGDNPAVPAQLETIYRFVYVMDGYTVPGAATSKTRGNS